MCFSIQRPLPHKPENNFWLDFLPAFLLRAGGGGGGGMGEHTAQRSGLGNGSQEPGGSLSSAWGWGKSHSSLGITVAHHLGEVWDAHYAGQPDTLHRPRCATTGGGGDSLSPESMPTAHQATATDDTRRGNRDRGQEWGLRQCPAL